MDDKTEEHPAPDPERILRCARTSRKYLLYAVLSCVLWFVLVLCFTGSFPTAAYGERLARFNPGLAGFVLLVTSIAGGTFCVFSVLSGWKAWSAAKLWVMSAWILLSIIGPMLQRSYMVLIAQF